MRKEDFFEVLGELDENIVTEAKTISKRRISRVVWGAAAACIAAALGVGMLQISSDEKPISSLKPVINFEGVVAAVEGDSIVLKDGKTILITKDTLFMGDPDTGNTVSADIQAGNFIQGYTADDADASEITAGRIWTNEGRAGSAVKRVVNFEGRVTELTQDGVMLDSGKTVRITEDTNISAPDGSPTEIAEGNYIQGYAENLENTEITAKFILVTTL